MKKKSLLNTICGALVVVGAVWLFVACGGNVKNESAPAILTEAVPFAPDGEEAAALAAGNEQFAAIFAFMKQCSLDTLPKGRYEIDGEKVTLTIMEGALKERANAALEVHNRYYDLQIPLSQAEEYGIAAREICVSPRGEFNEKKDILFYDDAPTHYVTLQPGEAIIFSPEVAHAPMVGEGTIRKAVFKILRECVE